MQDINETLKQYDYLSPDIAKKHGISKYLFYKYIKENDMEQVNHGIYAKKDEWIDELYIIHKRCPKGIFSHDEAFYYHGLSEREPLVHTLTIYSGYNSHRLITDSNCKVYTVKKELLLIGKTTVKDPCGNDIPMYDLERTICDLFRSRSSIEIQEFNAILKAYVSRKDKNLNRLTEYGRSFRIHNIIRKYMGVLL